MDNTRVAKFVIENALVTKEQLQRCLKQLKAKGSLGQGTDLLTALSQQGLVTSSQAERIAASLRAAKAPVKIQGYEITDKIGHGSMGQVFRAKQLALGRDVALKVLPNRLAGDRTFVERFLREARTAAKLNHPNIVRALDAGKSGAHYYFAMEYVDGKTIRALLKEKGRFSPKETVVLARQMSAALEHAESFGLIHRDIKPANILCSANGTAKLGDFGLARSASDTSLTLTGSAVLGTPNYVSPEQVAGIRELDIRTDIYSLGVTLYHLATGQVPFKGETSAVVMAKRLHEDPAPPHERERTVPRDLSAVIMKMMARERENRYQTAEGLSRDLDALIAGKRPSAADAPAGAVWTLPGIKAHGPRRRPALIAAVVVLLVVAGAVGYLLLPSKPASGPADPRNDHGQSRAQSGGASTDQRASPSSAAAAPEKGHQVASAPVDRRKRESHGESPADRRKTDEVTDSRDGGPAQITPTPAWDATRVSELFTGSCTDLGSGRIRLAYDFSDVRQLDDWACLHGQAGIADSALTLTRGGKVSFYAPFAGDLSVDMQVADTDDVRIYILAPDTHMRSGYYFDWRWAAKVGTGYMAAGVGGASEFLFRNKRALPGHRPGSPATISLRRKGPELRYLLNNSLAGSGRDPNEFYNSGQLFIHNSGDRMNLRQVSITGTPNPAWVKRELRAEYPGSLLTLAPADVRWRSLFDGRSLDEWSATGPLWTVDSGEIVSNRYGILYTGEPQWKDYVLRGQFKLEKGKICGFVVRMQEPDYTAADTTSPADCYRICFNSLGHMHGGCHVYEQRVLFSAPNTLPPGHNVWHDVTISVQGNSLELTVDGKNVAVPANRAPGAPRRLSRGYVGLYCGQSTVARFKNLQIKLLSKYH